MIGYWLVFFFVLRGFFGGGFKLRSYGLFYFRDCFGSNMVELVFSVYFCIYLFLFLMIEILFYRLRVGFSDFVIVDFFLVYKFILIF